MALERLQKILAQAGIASRRAAEDYITSGRVRVNGKIVRELGSKADPQQDRIEVVGHGALQAEPMAYILMHKPIHIVTTLKDPEGRQTVLDVLQQSRAVGRKRFEGNLPRVFPVGRLDFDVEGILLLTNDGELANALLHPRYHVPKTYAVKIKGKPQEKQLERLRRGVRLKQDNGRLTRPTKPAQVKILKESPANTWIELTITEGRHHQIKKMMEAVGLRLIRLIRTRFGGLDLTDLEPGEWRFLSEGEEKQLRKVLTDLSADKQQTLRH